MTMKSKENKTRSGETHKFERRYAELERKFKYDAEIAATTQKQEMTVSLNIPKQAEGVADAGVTALPHWNEDTNTAATVETRSGGFVAESEHDEVRLAPEAAAALHPKETHLLGSTEFEHADGSRSRRSSTPFGYRHERHSH